MNHRPLLAMCLTTVALSLPSKAQTLYTQDFEQATPPHTITGWTKIGGFNNNDIIDAAEITGSNSKVGFFDTNGSGYPVTTTIIADTFISHTQGKNYRLQFDLFKAKTGSPYVGSFVYELWVGHPQENGVILGSGLADQDTEGVSMILDTQSRVDAAGTLHLRFFAPEPTNTPDYAQVEIDNIELSILDEPQ